MDLASCHIAAADHLKAMLDRAVEANGNEHNVTRKRIQTDFNRTVQSLTASQVQQHELQKRQEIFLESLRFDDINTRLKDISESNPETFGWVFDDETSYAWDNLSNWLKFGQRLYWINGKAGSGKSTLMKFIINDQRTHDALKVWSNGRDCMTLQFYFWLSGSKLQRSMKGVLCSLLYQLLINNSTALENTFRNDRVLREKRTVGDWSSDEVKEILFSVIESMNCTGNICIFLDGVDEFDQDEDVQHLLDLIESLANCQEVKFCVSSRPEAYLEKRLSKYEKLRLQDLTVKDMEHCIKHSLNLTLNKYPPNSVDKLDVDKFIV